MPGEVAHRPDAEGPDSALRGLPLDLELRDPRGHLQPAVGERPYLLASPALRDDDLAAPLEDRQHHRDVPLVVPPAGGPALDRAVLERRERQRAFPLEARQHVPPQRLVRVQELSRACRPRAAATAGQHPVR